MASRGSIHHSHKKSTAKTSRLSCVKARAVSFWLPSGTPGFSDQQVGPLLRSGWLPLLPLAHVFVVCGSRAFLLHRFNFNPCSLLPPSRTPALASAGILSSLGSSWRRKEGRRDHGLSQIVLGMCSRGVGRVAASNWGTDVSPGPPARASLETIYQSNESTTRFGSIVRLRLSPNLGSEIVYSQQATLVVVLKFHEASPAASLLRLHSWFLLSGVYGYLGMARVLP